MRPTLDPADLRKAIRHLRRADAILGGVIDQIGPCTLSLQTRRFESLSRAIIAQQISGTAAKSIWRKLHLTLHPRRVTPANLAALPESALRQCGVSPQKLGYLRDLQERVLRRDVRLDRLHRLPNDDVIAELIRVKGIGVWTAQMFLMFSLGRLDVFPHLDLGIRSAIQRLYGHPELPDRSECELVAAAWQPYATVACWYLWRTGDK
jgi:DNA-3-methyladenine glycosylase II